MHTTTGLHATTSPPTAAERRPRRQRLRQWLSFGIAAALALGSAAGLRAQRWEEGTAAALTAVDDPPLPRAIDAALRRAGLLSTATLSWRERARWAATLPRLTARVQHARGLAQYLDLRSEAPERFDASVRVGWRIDLALSWDLGALVFAERELQVQRALTDLEGARRALATQVVDLYAERQRLRSTLRTNELDPEREARLLARYLRAGALLAALCGEQLFPSDGNRR
jgi:hypothetical protein